MRFIKANSFFDGTTFLANNSVLVLNDDHTLKEIVSENDIEKSNIECFEGTIMPGFVNAHCHLELSHLKNNIPKNTGLLEFAKHIISKRHTFSKEEIREAMLEADTTMYEKGIVAVGDISNGTDSFETKSRSKIFYHTFMELIGFNPVDSATVFDKGLVLLHELKNYNLTGSLAPHAPYSVSTELIKRIADMNLPFSIHNQESEEEHKFFMGEKSAFDDFYTSLNVGISWFNPPKKSSLENYVQALSHENSLLVHNTFTSANDVSLTKEKTVFWCFCPNANVYIENKLPDYTVFQSMENRICLGTDSLASNTQLDVMSEANLILKHTNVFSVETILKALTSNAANALGISENFGRFMLGKNAGLNLIEIENSQIRFIKKIV